MKRITDAGDVAAQRLDDYFCEKLKDEHCDKTRWEFFTFILEQAKNHSLDHSGYGSLDYQKDRSEAKIICKQRENRNNIDNIKIDITAYEERIKDYLSFLIRSHNEIEGLKLSNPEKSRSDYCDGYLFIFSKIISSLKSFLDNGFDYSYGYLYGYLRKLKNDNKLLCSLLRKTKKNRYDDGQYRATQDIDKGLASLIQTVVWRFDYESLRGV